MMIAAGDSYKYVAPGLVLLNSVWFLLSVCFVLLPDENDTLGENESTSSGIDPVAVRKMYVT